MKIGVTFEQHFDGWAGLFKAVDDATLAPVVLEAAKIIRSEAERRAPIAGLYGQYSRNRDRKPGRLRGSIRAIPLPKLGQSRGPVALAGQDIRGPGGDIWYARLVQSGTKSHYIGKGARGSSGSKAGKMLRGARPQPFFKDAVTATRAAARQKLIDGATAILNAVPTR